MYKATNADEIFKNAKNFGIIVCPISFVSDKIKHESSAMQTKSKKKGRWKQQNEEDEFNKNLCKYVHIRWKFLYSSYSVSANFLKHLNSNRHIAKITKYS